MPRDGSGVFSPPAGTTATAGTTIESAKYNAFVNDLVTDANTARPIVAGGTGATTAGAALAALGGQPLDAGLTSIAGLTTAADRMIYTTAADTYAVATLTAAGRALLDDADAAAQRTTLGLGALATAANVTTAEIAAATLVTAAETIESNNNNTTIPTSAAVVSYVPFALNAAGSAPMYAARAWVNFNGTGAPAIRGAGNVSSITDNGTGDYTVNFATVMPDANYCAVVSGKLDDTTTGNNILFTPYSYTTAGVRINANSNAGAKADCVHVNVAIFR